MSIFPIAEQTLTKSGMSVGTLGGVSQSKSATPRTSTSQQSGVSRAVEQSPVWRCWTRVAGIAKAPAKRAERVMNEVLMMTAVGQC